MSKVKVFFAGPKPANKLVEHRGQTCLEEPIYGVPVTLSTRGVLLDLARYWAHADITRRWKWHGDRGVSSYEICASIAMHDRLREIADLLGVEAVEETLREIIDRFGRELQLSGDASGAEWQKFRPEPGELLREAPRF